MGPAAAGPWRDGAGGRRGRRGRRRARGHSSGGQRLDDAARLAVAGARQPHAHLPARTLLSHARHAAARRHSRQPGTRHGDGSPAPGIARADAPCRRRHQRRPLGVLRHGDACAHYAGHGAHAARGREERPHGRNDGARRRLLRRRDRPLGGLVYAAFRAAAHGLHRHGDRPDRRAHVPADLRARRSRAVIELERIRTARATAAGAGRRVVEVLEESCALAPEAFTRALAATLTYRPLSMAELHALEPDFERLPFAVALERGCVPFREASGALLLVIGDPFDRELQAWAESYFDEAFSIGLAHRADLTAYLARYEETLRAMDSVLRDAAQAGEAAKPVEDLSF